MMLPRRIAHFQTLIALSLILLILGAAVPTQAATRCFGQTGQCVSDLFGDFWQGNGALPVFGYPLIAAVPETNTDTGQTYVTQWLERERLELHPENQAPYTILLGRLGVARLSQLGRDWTTFPKADPNTPHYFAATGHAIAPQFWDYWRTQGLNLGDPGITERESLALFGYPLSQAAMETNSSGDTVLTQWFERARFEYHPNQPAPYQVLLGLLGKEVMPSGIPATSPSYEDRTGVAQTLLSYYNGINRREYQRSYSYWETPGASSTSTPPDYTTFVRGFVDTTYVAVTTGTPTIDAGAGNVWASAPAVIRATMLDGSIRQFAGCYVLHHTNPGIDPRPDAALWKLNRAAIDVAPASAAPASLMAGLSCAPAP
jgi:hypothetical protein